MKVIVFAIAKWLFQPAEVELGNKRTFVMGHIYL